MKNRARLAYREIVPARRPIDATETAADRPLHSRDEVAAA
jgi:hypothetical protein